MKKILLAFTLILSITASTVNAEVSVVMDSFYEATATYVANNPSGIEEMDNYYVDSDIYITAMRWPGRLATYPLYSSMEIYDVSDTSTLLTTFSTITQTSLGTTYSDNTGNWSVASGTDFLLEGGTTYVFRFRHNREGSYSQGMFYSADGSPGGPTGGKADYNSKIDSLNREMGMYFELWGYESTPAEVPTVTSIKNGGVNISNGRLVIK